MIYFWTFLLRALQTGACYCFEFKGICDDFIDLGEPFSGIDQSLLAVVPPGFSMGPTWFRHWSNMFPTWFQHDSSMVLAWFQHCSNLVPAVRCDRILGCWRPFREILSFLICAGSFFRCDRLTLEVCVVLAYTSFS